MHHSPQLLATLVAASSIRLGVCVLLAALCVATLAVAGESATVATHAAAPIDWSRVRDVAVSPAAVRLVGRDSRQQLLVTATYLDGTVRDATRDVAFACANPQIARVSPTGVVEPLASGETVIEIRTPERTLKLPLTVDRGDQFLPLDFTADIVPLLTKAGCNGGGCHGKSDGRGGFQLSLFGYDPARDYHAIVTHSRGRRIFPGDTGESLLLRKATAAVPHGGGTRLRRDHPEFERLQRWIDGGTPWGGEPGSHIARIEVSPDVRSLPRNVQQQVVVTAVLEDGSRRDVTRTTEFRSNSPSIATVDELGLVTTGERLGETAIVCIHRGQVGVSRILVPLPQPAAAPIAEIPVANFIDEHVARKLRQLGVSPAPLVDDASFLRRASLQIAGKVPSASEVREFLADGNPQKRAALVDRLLDSGAFADHFAMKWSDILRNKRRGQADRLLGTIGFHRWLRNAIAENVPYDRIVRSVITATGNPQTNPPAEWYHEVRYLDRYVDDTAQVFLGVRIGCARCHNHPFEKFTQEDYYGLAAFFARVDRKGGAGVAERRANETIFVKAEGSVTHPVTGRVVPPHGLGAPPVEIPPFHDPRHALVDWMVRPDNPYFSHAFVNRMWAHFFSRGLIEPLDDMRLTNPSANETLLPALAAEFVQSGFDMRRIVRLICTSTTYQLAAMGQPEALDDTQFHSRFYPQRLSAELLLDAIDTVTGVPTKFGGLPDGTSAVQLPDEDFGNTFLNLFGRPPRESACECEREAKPNLAQALFLMNDPFFLGKVASQNSLAARLAKDPRPWDPKVEELYLTVMSRPPTAEELQNAVAYLRGETDAAEGFRNLLWVLLNTKEFLYIH